MKFLALVVVILLALFAAIGATITVWVGVNLIPQSSMAALGVALLTILVTTLEVSILLLIINKFEQWWNLDL